MDIMLNFRITFTSRLRRAPKGCIERTTAEIIEISVGFDVEASGLIEAHAPAMERLREYFAPGVFDELLGDQADWHLQKSLT